MLPLLFENREDAGWQLAKKLTQFKDDPDAVVLALPRGGVPVAFEIAEELHLPLDVFIVRKLGVPHYPELAMGAIASGGDKYLDENLIWQLELSSESVRKVIESETRELQRREALYRGEKPPRNLSGATVILVDDGLATGASMIAAIRAVRARNPRKVIVAVPVAAASSKRKILPLVDGFFEVGAPENFRAVGQWYAEFGQTTDEEVHALLQHHERDPAWKQPSTSFAASDKAPSRSNR